LYFSLLVSNYRVVEYQYEMFSSNVCLTNISRTSRFASFYRIDLPSVRIKPGWRSCWSALYFCSSWASCQLIWHRVAAPCLCFTVVIPPKFTRTLWKGEWWNALRNTTIYPNLFSPGQKDTYVARDKKLFPRITLKRNVIKNIIFVIKSKKKRKNMRHLSLLLLKVFRI